MESHCRNRTNSIGTMGDKENQGRARTDSVGSTGSTSDIKSYFEKAGKRKREEEVSEEIKNFMKKILEEMTIIKEELVKNNKEMMSMKEEFYKKEQAWELEKKDLTKRINDLEDVEEERQRKEKKLNVIIKGVEGERGSVEFVHEKVFKHLKMVIKVKESYRVGRKYGDKSRPIMVKLETWEDKRELMMRKKMLHGTRIYIDDDYTKKEREIQKRIQDKAREIRKEGERVKIGYKKVWIGDKMWVWDNSKEKLKLGNSGRIGEA